MCGCAPLGGTATAMPLDLFRDPEVMRYWSFPAFRERTQADAAARTHPTGVRGADRDSVGIAWHEDDVAAWNA